MNTNKELKNIFLALFLSVLILFIWNTIFPPSNIVDFQNESNESSGNKEVKDELPVLEKKISREEALNADKRRVSFENNKIKGSILLKGAIIDDLLLKQYKQNLEKDSPNITLLSPKGTEFSSFVEFGWLIKDQVKPIFLPDKETLWSVDDKSTPNNILLFWDNKQGQIFQINISLDDKYMFSIMQKVVNNEDETLDISTYSLLNRIGSSAYASGPRTNEGVLAVVNSNLNEYDYKKLIKKNNVRLQKKEDLNKKKWIAFSDKYWLTAVIMPTIASNVDLQSAKIDDNHIKSQISFVTQAQVLEPKQSIELSSNLFVGAKNLDILDDYANKYKIMFFDRSLDFGMFYFLSKPLLIFLQYFFKITHNFGMAILLLTIIVKILMFPLSVKAHVSAQKMKLIQPKINDLQQKYKNDRIKLNAEMLNLFKNSKTSPFSGCLPIIIQIPVFIALYKILVVSIDMRHAEFFGWIKDLSAQDPINIFFFLRDTNVPFFSKISMGFLPILLTITMILQQKITGSTAAAATDPNQEKMIKMMPYVFLFIFASFPAGLLIYWICSNIMSIVQHVLILKFYKVR